MELLDIHPHAHKHGLTRGEIERAWRNAFEWARRDRDDGRAEYIILGVDSHGRIVEMAARSIADAG